MDEEQVNKFNESLSNARAELDALNRALGSVTTAMGGTSAASERSARAQAQAQSVVDKNAKAIEKEAGARGANTNAVDANTKAQEQYSRAMGALGAAVGGTVATMISLTKALAKGTPGFEKYGDAIDKATNTAADLAGEFGILGKIIGMFIKTAGEAAKAMMKQADDVGKATDSLRKVGAAGAITHDQVIKMGHQAGYASSRLESLVKPIESMKGGLIALGGTAGEGVKEFGKMAAVGKETRESFRRLGISQDELTQHQADYVTLQRMSGRVITQQMKDSGALQKASLAYTQNLVELSAITGKNVEEAKKELEATQATYTRQIQNARESAELAKLQKVLDSSASEGEKAKAKARMEEIEAMKKNRQEIDNALSAMPLDEAAKTAYQTFMETGVRTQEFNDTFGQLNINFDAQREAYKKGTLTQGEIMESMKKGVLEQADKLGDYATIAGKEGGKKVGLGAEMLAFAASNAANDMKEGVKDAKKGIQDAAAGKGPVGEDPVDKARNTEAESAIRASVALDEVMWAANPIAHGVFPDLASAGEKLLAVLKDLAVAVAAVAAAIGLAKLFKGVKAAFGIAKSAAGALGRGLKAAGPAVARGTKAIGQGLANAGRGLAGFGSKAAGMFGGAGAGAAKLGTKAMGALGTAARAGGKFAKFIPGAGTALALGMGAYDAYKGYQADKDASIGERLKNAGSSALSGATFGLLGSSPEEIAARKLAESKTKPAEKLTTATPTVAPKAEETPEQKKERIMAEMKAKASERLKELQEKQAAKLEELENKKADLLEKANEQQDDATKKAKAQAEEIFKASGIQTTALMNGTASFEELTKKTGLTADMMQMANDFGTKQIDTQKLLTDAQSKATKVLDDNKDKFTELNDQLKLTGPKTDQMMKDVTKSVETNSKSMFSGLTDMVGGMFGGMFGGGKSQAGGAGSAIPGGIGSTSSSGGGTLTAQAEPSAGGGSSSAIIPRSGPGAPTGSSEIPNDIAGENDPDNAVSGADVSPKLATTVPKNVTLGPGVDISGVESPLLSRFFTAAGEFGKPIRINSAYRGDEKQAELWVRGRILGDPSVHTPARPKNDTNITYKGKEYQVAGSGRGSRHREGEALDISADRRSLDPILEKYGLHRPYKFKDPPHVELKAEKGGIASGPKSGYPATLHGNEIIVPLDPNSILAELGKKSKAEIDTEIEKKSNITTSQSDGMKELVGINQAMMEMMSEKFDNMISKLADSNDTQGKLLKYSQA